jgi:hypothetical protein
MFCADLKKIIDFYYLIGGNCVEIKQLCIYIQAIQGFMHDDHEDLINKHVMMIRVTDNM